MNSRNTSVQSSLGIYGSLALGNPADTMVLCKNWHNACIMGVHVVPCTLHFNELRVDLLRSVTYVEIMFNVILLCDAEVSLRSLYMLRQLYVPKPILDYLFLMLCKYYANTDYSV